MDLFAIIQTLTIWALPVVLAITLHEAAHAYAAWRLGDPTAAMLGRVTLNPLAHMDWLGTVAMPLALYVLSSGAFVFGYAKPVPVRFDRLRKPKQSMIWVALAGPAANLVQALAWMLMGYIWLAIGVQEPWGLSVCRAGVLVNCALFAFNLLPLPPLDGGRVAVGLLPIPAARALSRIEPWGMFIVLALVLSGLLQTYWMDPAMAATWGAIQWALSPLRFLLF